MDHLGLKAERGWEVAPWFGFFAHWTARGSIGPGKAARKQKGEAIFGEFQIGRFALALDHLWLQDEF